MIAPVLAIAIVILLPITGSTLLVGVIENTPFFVETWGNRIEFSARLWLLASFISSVFFTVTVTISFVIDGRYQTLREHKIFKYTAIGVIIFLVIFVVLSLITFIIPAEYYGIWPMKLLALLAALIIWILDYSLLWVARDKEAGPDLIQEFANTVRLIDIPVFISIFLVLALAWIYHYPPILGGKEHHDAAAAFSTGFSAGAVAVELVFANLIYWLSFSRTKTEE